MTTNCNLTGTFHPCLYPPCSRPCIQDGNASLYDCTVGNGQNYYRACSCGVYPSPIATDKYQDLAPINFFLAETACVSRACRQEDQEVWWEAWVGLCMEDGYVVNETKYKPAGFGIKGGCRFDLLVNWDGEES